MITILNVEELEDKVNIYFNFQGDKIKFDSHIELTKSEYRSSLHSLGAESIIVDHLLKNELHWLLSRQKRVYERFY